MPGCNERTDGRRKKWLYRWIDGWICQPRASERAKARGGASLARYASNTAGVRRAVGVAGEGRGAKLTWLFPNHAFHRLRGYKVLQGISYAARVPEMGAQ